MADLPVSELSMYPHCLQTTVRQLGLESSIRHTHGWLELIICTCIYLEIEKALTDFQKGTIKHVLLSQSEMISMLLNRVIV